MPSLSRQLLALLLFAAAALPAAAQSWWNPAWSTRRTITVKSPAPVASPILIRLFDGNFNFDSAQDNGADIRFTSADGKSVLPHHFERYDRTLNEALVWVKAPETSTGDSFSFHLYSGNPTASASDAKPAASYDPDTSLVYHFSEPSGPPADSSASAVAATGPTIPVAGALIAGGIRFTGQNALTIPTSPALASAPGSPLTWSAWIRPVAFRPNAIIFSRRNGPDALLIGEDNGIPFLEITSASNTRRTSPGSALAKDTWRHLAVTANASSTTLWLDGERYASIDSPLPALDGPSSLGRDADPASTGFNGEIDELQIARTTRSPESLRFAALSQGTSPNATNLVSVSNSDESGTPPPKPGFFKEHFGIFADISKSLTVDGWAVIILCSILAVIGAFVALTKILYLNRIDKASRLFTSHWDSLASDITALERSPDSTGPFSSRELSLVRQSPLFHIYHLGAHEITQRINAAHGRFPGLSARSIEAIKARLDGGLVDEEERLNSRLVFLTLSIAGGPYLGLLGTVIGVMITFAVIAKSGEVEVNSIAPGIAGALLATVAGLAVAIPALFSYSYLNARITSALNGIRRFIDEFITRIAEAYPTADDS